MSERLRIKSNFFNKANHLRQHFESQFADPLALSPQRFVWDFWHVPQQYSLLRTPAHLYFPKALYHRFHEQLVLWGREFLGCHDVSPPWLSCYVDGCEQLMHADVPHGPWAFVYALTAKRRQFSGGRTLLLRDEILNYWAHSTPPSGIEHGQIFEAIEPNFNQLTVFDSRIPHAVERVRGSLDPREGRLVIHGWFVSPRPFIQGGLHVDELAEKMTVFDETIETCAAHAFIRGTCALRFDVEKSGAVSKIRVLMNTLRSEVPLEANKLLLSLKREISQLSFRKQKRPSVVTLPIVISDVA